MCLAAKAANTCQHLIQDSLPPVDATEIRDTVSKVRSGRALNLLAALSAACRQELCGGGGRVTEICLECVAWLKSRCFVTKDSLSS